MTMSVISQNIDGIELPEPVYLVIGSDDGMFVRIKKMSDTGPVPDQGWYVNDDNWTDVGVEIMKEVFDRDV